MSTTTASPKSIQECYDRGICTYAFTGNKHVPQIWYRTPEWPTNEGFCLVCANAHYGNRTSEWIGMNSNFYCDLGDRGQSSKLPTSFFPFTVIPTAYPQPISQVSSTSNSCLNELIVNPGLRLERNDRPTKAETVLDGLTVRGEAVVVKEDLTTTPNMLGDVMFHSNYANYLFNCWATHAGLVIRPSDIWFIVAGQLAKHINDPVNAETYRRYFSDAAPGAAKEKLVFVVANPDLLNIDMIIDRLKTKVKIDTSLFCPTFSDSTNKSREAIGACFCEAMEAYYDYCTTLCGISKVRVCGTREDWYKISEVAMALGEILTNAKTYLQGVAELAVEIWEQRSNPDTWENFFKIRDCGSGHDQVVVGSITKLYSLTVKMYDFSRSYSYCNTSRTGQQSRMDQCKDGNNLAEFKDGSQVTYTNMDTKTKFKKTYGIMSSVLGPDGFQTPCFNYVLLRLVDPEERVLNMFQGEERELVKRIKLQPLEVRQDMFALNGLLSRNWSAAEPLKKWLNQ